MYCVRAQAPRVLEQFAMFIPLARGELVDMIRCQIRRPDGPILSVLFCCCDASRVVRLMLNSRWSLACQKAATKDGSKF
jgi:hypothetical protein